MSALDLLDVEVVYARADGLDVTDRQVALVTEAIKAVSDISEPSRVEITQHTASLILIEVYWFVRDRAICLSVFSDGHVMIAPAFGDGNQPQLFTELDPRHMRDVEDFRERGLDMIRHRLTTAS